MGEERLRYPDTVDTNLAHDVCDEYREMPGLCLTLAQACRLWTVPPPVAQRVLDHLIAGHVLRRDGAFYVRAD